MATTVLSLLNEPDNELKQYALQTLDRQVNELWPEIADHIPVIEELHEDAEFPATNLAALVVAKVYYNLGDLDLALKYALSAGSELDLSQKSEFIDTIVGHGIRTYIARRQQVVDHHLDVEEDEKLTRIVEEMLERCVAGGHVLLSLGTALEARRLDLVEAALQSAHDPETLGFVLDATALLRNREFRSKVLRALSKVVDAVLHAQPGTTPYYALATKLAVQLDDTTLATRLLSDCAPQECALQIAFDLAAGASRDMLDLTAAHFMRSPLAHHAKIVKILGGVLTCDFNVTFLERNSHADLGILQATKSSLDARNSIFHSALSFQNALLHLGTTHDGFFRTNIDWLGKATHWAKFTATSALGVIHQGNLAQGRRVLQPYLVKGGNGSGHVKGGALYGMGLVFAGFGKDVLPSLTESVVELVDDEDAEVREEDSDAEVQLHGACLGVGLAGMQTQNADLHAKLLQVIYRDTNVGSSAAGLALGLVLLGSKHQEAEKDMLALARATQHEKLQLALPLGIAFLNFGKEEACEGVVDELLAEHESSLRYGACFTLALAYCGTGDANATKRLLHLAVSDPSDDVRRSAMMALGFLYARQPAALPRMVELLSASHNPHVRYGSAIALGIGCAGTGLTAAIDVLEPMLQDPVDFVRQGSMIALALILVQHTEQNHPRAKSVRDHFAKIAGTKNEDALAKFGAVLAQGLIDAGGCNTTISLENHATGTLNVRSVVGLTMFLQYWNWFPLTHFVSLAYVPTSLVCVTPDLKIPKFNLVCEGAPAKRFAYPAKFEEPAEKVPEQLVTAILSTTLKELRRKHAKTEKKEEVNTKQDEEKRKREEQAANNTHFEVPNLGRVLPWQRKYMRFAEDSRATPVAPHRELGGVLVVSAGDELSYVKTQRQTYSAEDEVEEAPLPLPFKVPLQE